MHAYKKLMIHITHIEVRSCRSHIGICWSCMGTLRDFMLHRWHQIRVHQISPAMAQRKHLTKPRRSWQRFSNQRGRRLIPSPLTTRGKWVPIFATPGCTVSSGLATAVISLRRQGPTLLDNGFTAGWSTHPSRCDSSSHQCGERSPSDSHAAGAGDYVGRSSTIGGTLSSYAKEGGCRDPVWPTWHTIFTTSWLRRRWIMYELYWQTVRLRSTWSSARWTPRRSWWWTTRHGSNLESIVLVELYTLDQAFFLEEVFCDIAFNYVFNILSFNVNFVGELYALDGIYGGQGFADGCNYAHHYGVGGIWSSSWRQWWHIACAPHSWLTEACLQQGLRPRRINLHQGFDAYKDKTCAHHRELQRQHKPKRLWFSLRRTLRCQWTYVNYSTPEKKILLAAYRRKEIRMLWNAVHFIENTLKEDPSADIYWEWPWPCIGWGQGPLLGLQQVVHANGREWLPCRIDGCNYGLRANDGSCGFSEEAVDGSYYKPNLSPEVQNQDLSGRSST